VGEGLEAAGWVVDLEAASSKRKSQSYLVERDARKAVGQSRSAKSL
jgi:hypothetical protein